MNCSATSATPEGTDLKHQYSDLGALECAAAAWAGRKAVRTVALWRPHVIIAVTNMSINAGQALPRTPGLVSAQPARGVGGMCSCSEVSVSCAGVQGAYLSGSTMKRMVGMSMQLY